MESTKLAHRFWFLYPTLIVLVLLGYHFSLTLQDISENPFLNWDAEHYYWIKNNGYEGFRVAFFPLFPMVWKLTHLPVFGIVIFNALVYLYSLHLLFKYYSFDGWNKLLVMTIPSTIFFYLPYSESLFFFSSSLVIIGLVKENQQTLLFGLLLCIICRPAISVLVPALIIMELFDFKANKKVCANIFTYLVISAIGLTVVSSIQHYYTGKWFEFFSVQSGWGNQFGLPKFPLTTWGGRL